MESEISLIEMGGVDDDLLVEDLIEPEKSKATTATTATTTYTPLLDLDLDESIIDFSCSPLLIDRSKLSVDRPRIPRPEVKGKGEMQKSCISPPRCMNNKENHNENSVGSTSSPDSSHTMKKRKKRGGFNLRKSLAWNKAFFTEEGVLDPLELSRLSHSISKPNGEFLSVVPEEGRTAMIKGSRVCGGGSPLQTLEEDMLSELRAKSVNEDRRCMKNMSPVTLPSIRENAASVSSASRKLQLIKSPYKSVSSGGGCPRPSGSSSQKRLPNTSAISSSMKESKLPRRTVLKPESSSISATSKHTVAGAKRCNQKTPTANTEKNVGIKGPLNKTKTARGLASSSSKSSALHLGKNMASKGSSSGLKQTADPVRRADTHIPIQDGGRKVTFSLPQNAHFANRNIPAQSQPTKPSGLRMPSPSIGYFGQPKTSASHSIQSLRNTQSSNAQESGIPNPRKLSHSNQNGATLSGTSRLTKGNTDTKVGASSLSSMSKCLIPSIAATTSQPPLKSKIQLKNPEVEAKASSFRSVYNQTNSQQELHSIHDVESGKLEVARNNAHDEGEQIFQENWKLGVNDASLLVHSKYFEQLQEDSKLENMMAVSQNTENVSGSELGSEHVPVSLNSKIQVEGVVLADNMIEHNHEERVQLESLNSNMLIGDHNVISNVKFCDDNGVDTSLVHVEGLREAHRVSEISRELLEVIKPGPELSSQNFTFDIEQIQNEEDKRLQISECILVEDQGVSEGSRDNDSSVDTSMVHAESLGFSAHHVSEKCGVLAEVVKPVSVEVGEIQHKENERLQISDILMKRGFSEEAQKDSDNSGGTTSVVHAECLGFAHYVDEELGEIQHKENERLQISEIILIEQGGFSEEAQKDNENSGVTTSVVHAESSGFAHYVNEESGEQAEAANPGSGEVEQIQHMNQQLHLPDSAFVEQWRLSEEFQEDNDNSIIAAHVGNSTVHVESFGFVHHVNKKSGVLTEVVKPGSDEQSQHIENQRLHLPDRTLLEPQGLSEEFQEDNNKSVIGTRVGTSMEHVENLGFSHHVNDESGKLAEVVKPVSDEVEQVQQMENLRLHLPDSILVVQRGLSEESHDDNNNTMVGTCVDTSMVHVESLGFAHHVTVKSGDLSEAVKPGSNDVEQLQLSDRISVEQCGSSEETPKDNFLGNDTFVSESGCWMGTSDILFPVAPDMQLNEVIAIVDNMKDNQQAGCYQFERLDYNFSENCDSIYGTEFSDLIDNRNHAHCSRAVDDVDEPATKQIKLSEKSPPHVIKEILLKGDHSFEMNDKTLLVRSRSTEELQKDDHNTLVLQSRASGESHKDNDIGNVIYVSPKTSKSGGNSCKKSHTLSQLELNRQVKEGDAGNDNTIEHHPVEINDSAEGTLGFISCLELSKQTSDSMICDMELVSSPLSVSTSSGIHIISRVEQTPPDHIDDTISKNDISLEKTETNLSPSIEIPDGEQCESENAVSPMKCTDPTLSVKRSSLGCSNHDALTLKYKIKAVPFSDEWLAAMEAAGEDILTMKSGAVQNSPTEKSLPEPSPWSPVKRKNQEIGPFDCTKCTNLTPPNIP